MKETTILGTGKSSLKYHRPETGEVWVINRAFLLEQNPDILFMFHPVNKVFNDINDRMLLKHAKPRIIGNQKEDLVEVSEYPIDKIMDTFDILYFRCSLAYCLAYASMNGYER